MDRDARKRAISAYLVQRAVPMLPPQLSEQLCSLQPEVERLTFSAMFVMDKTANILQKTFKRSIIRSAVIFPPPFSDLFRSCAKLAYADAQAVIEHRPLLDSKVGDPHTVAEVESDIRALYVRLQLKVSWSLTCRRIWPRNSATEGPRLEP